MLWSMVSKAADRSRTQRHDNFCDPMALIRWSRIGPIQQGCFSWVMLAVGRLVTGAASCEFIGHAADHHGTFKPAGQEKSIVHCSRSHTGN